jgi:3-methyladenine DNA glycosylase AlkC
MLQVVSEYWPSDSWLSEIVDQDSSINNRPRVPWTYRFDEHSSSIRQMSESLQLIGQNDEVFIREFIHGARLVDLLFTDQRLGAI